MLDFLKIVLTSPYSIRDEEVIIPELIEQGYDYVHIRKPDWKPYEVENLIRAIPKSYHPKLKIHSCFELLKDYDLGGVHLNHRNPIAPANCDKVSRSCHSVEELQDSEQYEYQFLSPIFESISKKGYRGNYNLIELTSRVKDKKVVALGGITPDRFEVLQQTGFSGAALLGYIWNKYLHQ